MLKVFNYVRFFLKKTYKKNYIYLFYNEELDLFSLRKMAIWLLCNAKVKNICKKCISCKSFLKKNNFDYYELIEKNEDFSIIFNLKNIIKNSPLTSNFKIILIILKNANTIMLQNLTKLIIKNKIFVFIVLKFEKNKINNNDFFIPTENKIIKPSFYLKKIIYKNIFINIKKKEAFHLLKEENEVAICLIIKLLYNLIYNKKINNKHILILLKISIKYKAIFEKKININIHLFINFLILFSSNKFNYLSLQNKK